MLFPVTVKAQDLFSHVHHLILKEGKMVSKAEFSKVRTQTSKVHIQSQFSKKKKVKNFFRRNKTKTSTAVIGVTAAIVTTATGANLVAIPLFFAGYGLKKGLTHLSRRKKYKFVKAFLLTAKTHGNYQDLVNELTSENIDQQKALTTLRHWFTHRRGRDISTYVDRIRDLRGYYERFKGCYHSKMPKEPRKCDHVVETLQWMYCYANMLDGIAEMTAIFTGCYLYVLNEFNIMQQDFSKKSPVILNKLLQHLYLGSHQTCGNICYSSGGTGKKHFKGPKSTIALERLLQDAAHSKDLFGSGSRDRLGWVWKALGLKDLKSSRPTPAKPLQESFTEELKGVIFDPQDPLSSHMVQSLTGNLGTGWIAGKNSGESLGFSGTEGGLKSGIQGGFFSLAGDTSAQLGANAFAFAGALAGPLMEVGNSVLNKHQLKHSDPLSIYSLRHQEGLKRLDILRANLKKGLLESWVKTFFQFQKAHKQCMNLSIRPITTCADAYHLSRSMLQRQKAFTEFMGSQSYVQEFYTGVVGKIARMTAHWTMMAQQMADLSDTFMRNHPQGHCQGTFCYNLRDEDHEVLVKCSQKPQWMECKHWHEDLNFLSQKQLAELQTSFKKNM